MKNKDFNTNTKNNDEWLTPKYITDFFDGDLDPCSPINRPWLTAKKHYTVEDDGLSQEWEGFVWCNPPYGRDTFTWINKLAEHNNGIALIFARTETRGFHKEIWNKATSIFFFKGRIKFFYVDGTQGDCANAPSCLVAYGKEADERLKKFAELYEGKYINLSTP
jgi:hypothetical protein